MTSVVFLGLLAGLGLAGLLYASAPRRMTLTAAVARMDGALQRPRAEGLRGRRQELSAATAQWIEQRSLLPDRAVNALDLLEVELADLVSECTKVVGALAVAVLAVLALLAWGLHAPIGAGTALLGLAGSLLVGTVAEVLAVRQRANAAREQMRRALGLFLLLVSQCLAAGLGIQGALKSAGEASPTRPFARIIGTLERARATGRSPWAALADLGSRWQIPDFSELAATIDLAGNQGAKVRESLAAKAASMRKRDMAETEAAAGAVTERMFLPSTVMFLGFLVLVGYPALVAVTRTV